MMHIVQVKLDMAIRAESKEIALQIASDTMKALADDGSLSDLMVFQWHDPEHIEVEGEDD